MDITEKGCVDLNISARVIGRNMKQTRISLGFTQEKAAELLNIFVQNYGRFERGERFPTLPQLALIAEAFNTSMETLLSGSSFRIFSSSIRSDDHFNTVISFLSAGCSSSAKALMLDVCQLIAARDKHIGM